MENAKKRNGFVGGSCIALGWFAFRGNSKKELFSSNYLYKQLDAEGLKLGKIGKVFAFMVKYVTPVLIAVIEIIGVIDVVFPSDGESREFSIGGLIIVLTAYFLLIVALLVYFLCLRTRDTGTNEDEIKDGKKE